MVIVLLTLIACGSYNNLQGTVTDKEHIPGGTEVSYIGCGIGFDGKFDCTMKPKIVLRPDQYFLMIDGRRISVSEITYSSYEVGDWYSIK